MTSRSDVAFFEHILEHLRQTRGFDFTAYKRTSLMRRVIKRMQTVNVQTFEQYLDYLQVHQEEFAALFNTILINVTSFFRDPDVWAYISTDVLPPLLKGRSGSEPIRIWSAGTASGVPAPIVTAGASRVAICAGDSSSVNQRNPYGPSVRNAGASPIFGMHALLFAGGARLLNLRP